MSDIDLKESGYGVRVLPREILGGLLQQSSLRLHARDIQGTFKGYSRDIHGQDSSERRLFAAAEINFDQHHGNYLRDRLKKA